MEVHKPYRMCRRCLLKEVDEAEYREKLEKYIVEMPEKLKADETLYQHRLNVCKECVKLVTGTCLACGCYVELRAAAKVSRCPDKKW